MAYWLLFWHPGPTALTEAELAGRLRQGDWDCVEACEQVLELRRDVVASDPDWTSMSVLPRPGSGQPSDRYLALVFEATPTAEQVRDLRYVAARNRLRTYELGTS